MNPTGRFSGATTCSTRPAKSGLGCSEAIPRGLGLDDDDCGMADGSGGFDDTHDGFDPFGTSEFGIFTDPWILK